MKLGQGVRLSGRGYGIEHHGWDGWDVMTRELERSGGSRESSDELGKREEARKRK